MFYRNVESKNFFISWTSISPATLIEVSRETFIEFSVEYWNTSLEYAKSYSTIIDKTKTTPSLCKLPHSNNKFLVFKCCFSPVSYTHLDVYKRQLFNIFVLLWWILCIKCVILIFSFKPSPRLKRREGILICFSFSLIQQ